MNVTILIELESVLKLYCHYFYQMGLKSDNYELTIMATIVASTPTDDNFVYYKHALQLSSVALNA